MLENIFKNILAASLAGGLLTIAIALLRPITRRLFSARWQYYVWLAVLAVMLVPVRLKLPPDKTVYTAPQLAYTAAPPAQGGQPVTAPEPEPNSAAPATPAAKPTAQAYVRSKLPTYNRAALSIVWLAGMLAAAAVNILAYLRLLARIKSNCVSIDCPRAEKLSPKKITVLKGGFTSPFLVGIIRPRLILPDRELTPEQLENILRHELTHAARHDILYKWLAAAVKCIHWFNPAAYFAASEINRECEISCDLAAVSGLSREEEEGYVNTILSLLSEENRKKSSPLTTGMTGSKKMLKRRFAMIKNKRKTTRAAAVLSAVTAAVLTAGAALAGGLISGAASPEFEIELTYNDRPLTLENKPFFADGEVYLPLREMLNLAGIDNSSITYDNGYAQFEIPSPEPTLYRGIEYNSWINRVQRGSRYAYIGGHSYGSTENAELTASPMLLDGTMYVPMDLFEKLRLQQVFTDLRVSLKGEGDVLVPPVGEGSVSRVYSAEHNGIDLAVAPGTSVKAAIDGRVTESGFDAEMGNYAVISEQNGLSVMYAHLAESVSEGREVRSGEAIANAGKTGTATGLMLHFEITKNGEAVNPSDCMFYPKPLWQGTFALYESMSAQELHALDQSVLTGHFPWRHDPRHVLMNYAEEIGLGGGEITDFTDTAELATAVYTAMNREYIAKLAKSGESGMWVVTSFANIAEQLSTVSAMWQPSLFDIDGAELSPRDDGWYEIGRGTTAKIYVNGNPPETITAWYADAGSEMYDKKRVVGQRTVNPADGENPISVAINPENAYGHLWFEYTYLGESYEAEGSSFNIISK